MKRKPWYIGNTTVRNPYRLKDGLEVFYNSPYHGNLDTKETQKGFYEVLLKNGIISSSSIKDPDSFGRKWGAAFSQLGFIVHKEALKIDSKFHSFTVTTNGKRLINAKTVPEVNECFLRALSAYYIPSPLESYKGYEPFSPFKHVLNVMLNLKKITGSTHLYQRELGMFVQTTSSSDDINSLVMMILDYRDKRKNAPNKKSFDREFYNTRAENLTVVGDTLKHYADSNTRYLKITGLFRSKGKGIVIIPEKELLARQLVQEDIVPTDPKTYLTQLFNGASLPSDNISHANELLENLKIQMNNKGIDVDTSLVDIKDIQSVNAKRYLLEEELSRHVEIEYSYSQKNHWRDIVSYMDAIIARNSNFFKLPDSKDSTKIPREEFPAYFEWIVWRSFLAINNLLNKPYEARSFQIDQDFLPVHTAPGGKADAVFEFDDFVLVLEVTLTESSRQEAAEGEPVRRHVADYQSKFSQYKKPVYGLFLANKVNTNTIETFRNGLWYTNNDEKLYLKIVPMTLDDYKKIFISLFENNKVNNIHVKKILDRCLLNKDLLEAPKWRENIQMTMIEYINSL